MSVDYSGAQQLQDIVASSDAAPACFATHYYRFAKGYEEKQPDSCAVETLQERFKASNYNLEELLVEMVKLNSFVTRAQ